VTAVGLDVRASRVWLWTTVLLTAGAFTIAVVLAPSGSSAPVRGLTWLLFVGSSVHVASTAWLYTLTDVRSHVVAHKRRYIWAPVGLVIGAAITAAVISPAELAWLLLGYFAWQFLHFQKQNLGMAALAAASCRVTPLRPAERRALNIGGAAGIAGLVAHPGLLQMAIDPGIGDVFTVAALVFVGAVGLGLGALFRRPAPDRPAGFCTVYLVALLFSLPVFVFGSPYAAVGGMTIAHGLQYLLLVGLIAAGGRGETRRMLTLFVFFDVALILGLALSAASHLHGSSPAGRLLFGAYLGAVMAHFVIDAGLWRLRDRFPRSFMTRRLPYLVPPGSPVSHGRPVDRQPI
jgi:hypothetical protein